MLRHRMVWEDGSLQDAVLLSNVLLVRSEGRQNGKCQWYQYLDSTGIMCTLSACLSLFLHPFDYSLAVVVGLRSLIIEGAAKMTPPTSSIPGCHCLCHNKCIMLALKKQMYLQKKKLCLRLTSGNISPASGWEFHVLGSWLCSYAADFCSIKFLLAMHFWVNPPNLCEQNNNHKFIMCGEGSFPHSFFFFLPSTMIGTWKIKRENNVLQHRWKMCFFRHKHFWVI